MLCVCSMMFVFPTCTKKCYIDEKYSKSFNSHLMRQTQKLLKFGTRRNDTTGRKELHEYEKFIGRLMMLLCNPKSCAHIIDGGRDENGAKTDGTK
jgi:hypothetical protein